MSCLENFCCLCFLSQHWAESQGGTRLHHLISYLFGAGATLLTYRSSLFPAQKTFSYGCCALGLSCCAHGWSRMKGQSSYKNIFAFEILMISEISEPEFKEQHVLQVLEISWPFSDACLANSLSRLISKSCRSWGHLEESSQLARSCPHYNALTRNAFFMSLSWQYKAILAPRQTLRG